MSLESLQKKVLVAAMTGNITTLEKYVAQSGGNLDVLLLAKAPNNGNNILHIAGSHGHHKFIAHVLATYPETKTLLTEPNNMGILPGVLAAEQKQEACAALIKANDNSTAVAAIAKKLFLGAQLGNIQRLDTALQEAETQGIFRKALLLYQNDKGQTAAHIATGAPSDNADFIIELLKHRAVRESIFTIEDKNGDTALSRAAKSGSVGCFNAILERTGSNLELSPKMLETLIKAKQFCGNSEKVAAMESAFEAFCTKHNLHPQNEQVMEDRADSGNSPLHNAVVAGNLPEVKKLLSEKASVLVRNNADQSPMHLAFLGQKENPKLYQDIMKAILAAAAGQNQNCMAALVNLQDAEGNGVLHLAAQKAATEFIKVFTKFGANILAQNTKGESALHILMNAKHLILLEGTDDKHTALAAKADEAMKLIVQQAVDSDKFVDLLNLKAEDLTAIDLSLVTEDYLTLSMLLSTAEGLGADASKIIGGVDTEGFTALHTSVSGSTNSPYMLQVLSMFMTPKQILAKTAAAGQTALHMAIAQDLKPAAEGIALGARAKKLLPQLLAAEDGSGWTPLALAEHLGNKEMIGFIKHYQAEYDDAAAAANGIDHLTINGTEHHPDGNCVDEKDAAGALDHHD